MMSELSKTRTKVRRVIVGLILTHAIVTISLLLAFQSLSQHWVEYLNPLPSVPSNLFVFGLMFITILIPNAIIAISGYKWVSNKSVCIKCGSFLNHLLIRANGECHKCGSKWMSIDGEAEWLLYLSRLEMLKRCAARLSDK